MNKKIKYSILFFCFLPIITIVSGAMMGGYEGREPECSFLIPFFRIFTLYPIKFIYKDILHSNDFFITYYMINNLFWTFIFYFLLKYNFFNFIYSHIIKFVYLIKIIKKK